MKKSKLVCLLLVYGLGCRREKVDKMMGVLPPKVKSANKLIIIDDMSGVGFNYPRPDYSPFTFPKSVLDDTREYTDTGMFNSYNSLLPPRRNGRSSLPSDFMSVMLDILNIYDTLTQASEISEEKGKGLKNLFDNLPTLRWECRMKTDGEADWEAKFVKPKQSCDKGTL
jgi:hypothetical protein